MSFVSRTRTAKTVGKGRLSVSLKVQHLDCDERRNQQDEYHELRGDEKFERVTNTLSVKFGWARRHHLGVKASHFWNDIDVGGVDVSNTGVGNVAVFEKWNCIGETVFTPAVAVDAWYVFGTGKTDRKLGSSHSSGKLTAELSKTWRRFSVHLNPGCVLREGPDKRELNAALMVTPGKTLWPALEYNYESTSGKGRSCDLVPCFLWKFRPGACWKLGCILNLDATMGYRDRVGFVTKLSYTF